MSKKHTFTASNRITRGYFSEIVTDVEYGTEVFDDKVGSSKRTNFIWQVQTEKHAPVIKTIMPPEHAVELSPAERWMTFDEDDSISFCVDSFKPKVQLQHGVAPLELSRNVATERLRRLYQSKSIKTVLEELNVNPSQLVYSEFVKEYGLDKEEIYLTRNYVPLELFDDEEFDCRSDLAHTAQNILRIFSQRDNVLIPEYSA